MSTVEVRHYLYGPGRTRVSRRRCTVTLVGVGLWLDDGSGEIIDAVVAESDETGLVSFTVTPQPEIAATDSYYVLRVAGTAVARAFVAPVSAEPVMLVDCLVDSDTLDPVGPDLPSLYLARAELGVASGVAPLGTDGKVPSANLPEGSGGTTPDATTSSKGVLQLAGDLAGTADSPTVPGLADKADEEHAHTTDDISGLASAVAAGAASRGVQAVASSGQHMATFTGDTSGSWQLAREEYRVTIAAEAGDVLLWQPHLLVQVGGDAELDVASVVSGEPARFFSSGSDEQAANGHGGLYIGTGYNGALKPIRWVVTEDDLEDGTVTLSLMHRAGTGVTFGSALYPGQVDVTNLGGTP